MKLIIDCDPGVDDAIALLLALASPELEIVGISNVAGNVSLERIQKNTRQICELAGHPDAKVYPGCARPLLRPLATAEEVHGASGLGGVTLPEPTMAVQPTHGVDFLIDTLMNSAGDITLATLGPLTNVAIALIKEPRLVGKIPHIVLMGGSIGQGNITPSAEFNIYVDPHAAHVVFSSGIPLTMIGLNATHTVMSTPDRIDRIRANDNAASLAAADLLTFYGKDERDHLKLPGAPLHDPCVIAYLIQPDLFEVHPYHVEIEITSSSSMGRTIVSKAEGSDVDNGTHPANANVVLRADAAGFYDLLTQRLATL
ncbi:MAG: nucleoside hydrolase [Kaiparowitsia implicata GSE-PSE-MK54-09C]|jgi:purine nucleosidase|nr:nucleoside hydrolase [Kaiparowitsia implicata GSE-PSE-MK54-09C]